MGFKQNGELEKSKGFEESECINIVRGLRRVLPTGTIMSMMSAAACQALGEP
jgi:hypothetical protein